MLQVAVAVLQSEQGVLVAQRQAQGVHKAGMWEFPGGKIEAGEDQWQGLARECAEELGIQITAGRKLLDIVHHYPERSVDLHIYLVTDWQGEARGNEGQTIRWLPAQHYSDRFYADHAFLPMVKHIVNAVCLPSAIFITPALPDKVVAAGLDGIFNAYVTMLKQAQKQGVKLILLRNKLLQDDEYKQLYHRLKMEFNVQVKPQAGDGLDLIAYAQPLMTEAASDADAEAAKPMALNRVEQGQQELRTKERRSQQPNSQEQNSQEPTSQEPKSDEATQAEYLHYTQQQLMALKRRPDCTLFSASCHDMDSISQANQLACDFIFISAVKATTTHPDAKPLGLEGFEKLLKHAQMPAYALGGMDIDDIENIQAMGGQGIAAITAFLK